MTIWQNQPSSFHSLLPSQSFSSLNRAWCQLCHEPFPLLFLFACVGFIPCQAFDDIQQVQLCPLFLPEHGPLLLTELNENFPRYSRPSLPLIQSLSFVNTLTLQEVTVLPHHPHGHPHRLSSAHTPLTL